MSSRLSILLIEDNEADVRTVQRLLGKLDRPWSLEVQSNGQIALDYLGRITGNGASVPDIILLDLNLPRVHGLEVLEHYRQQEETRDVPVIILTTSMNERDQQYARDLGTEAFIRKPDQIVQWENKLLPLLRKV